MVVRQLQRGLAGLAAAPSLGSEGVVPLIIAYEPVWAIGTGRTASPETAQEMHEAVRNAVSRHFDEGTARGIRILYGGSVKPENIGGLMSGPDIDGALVGGASLEAASFLSIIHYNSR